ncbi:MAG: GNAT family N-acetyltransferase [Pseudomonadota bacterium]
MLTIRRATPSDIPMLGLIGPAAYAEAYGDWWETPAAYYAYLNGFGAAAFTAFFALPEARVWVAEVDGAPVGFLTMRLNTPDPVDGKAGGAWVGKIYMFGSVRGAGVGRVLLEAAEAEARTGGAAYLWLDSMARAEWAWRTYERWGFVQIGEIVLDNGLKPDRTTLLVMKRSLD